MTLTEFTELIERVADAHQKNINENTIKVYYEQFVDVDVSVFNDVATWAIRELDKFPTIKALLDYCRNRSISMGKKINSELARVQCNCGEEFCVRKVDLQPGNSFDCPKRFYELCTRVYDSGYIINQVIL